MDNEMLKKIQVFSYDVLAEFNALYYKDLITENHCGEETFILNPATDVKEFFYPLSYKKKVYALQSDKLDKLPIRVKESTKIGHRTSVYHWITNFSSAVIKGKKTMTLNELVKKFAPFEGIHSNAEHFWLYKAIVLALHNDKGFARIATEAGFGKTSLFNMLNPLTNKAVSFNPRSVAALEYRLLYSEINLDEMTNLQKAQRDLMQDALLKICDWAPTYQKGTRGLKKYGLQDDMDIKDTSLIVTYNITNHYIKSNQIKNYFDKLFQNAVLSRLIPFKLDGVLDSTAFQDIKNPKQVAKDNYDFLIEILKNLIYYKENLIKESHNYTIPPGLSFERS